MKIYIAGKVTGLDISEARSKFEHTEKQLIAAGIKPAAIINPMKLGIAAGTDWHCAMDVCLGQLKTCTAIYIQRDWRDSFGARREITEANRLRLDTFWEEQNDMAMLANLISAGV